MTTHYSTSFDTDLDGWDHSGISGTFITWTNGVGFDRTNNGGGSAQIKTSKATSTTFVKVLSSPASVSSVQSLEFWISLGQNTLSVPTTITASLIQRFTATDLSPIHTTTEIVSSIYWYKYEAPIPLSANTFDTINIGYNPSAPLTVYLDDVNLFTRITTTSAPLPSTTLAPTTTALPITTSGLTTTLAPTTTGVPTTTALPTTTSASTSTIAPTTTAVPTSTLITTTDISQTTIPPTTTLAPTSTSAPQTTLISTTTLPTTTIKSTTIPQTTTPPTTTKDPCPTDSEAKIILTYWNRVLIGFC
jgi:hypothetical protein